MHEELLNDVVRRILTTGDPISIVLSGSHARNEAQPGSNLDLLIIEDSDLPRHRRAGKYRRALMGGYPYKGYCCLDARRSR